MSEQAVAPQTQPSWPSWARLEVVVVLILLLLLGAPNLIFPFRTDQGEYAYIAERFLDGKVIYRDVFNVKPPGTHWIHAAALALFGHSMMALRVMDLLWQAATGVAIALITIRLYGRRFLGLLAGAIYGVTYYAADFWHSAQTDGFVNLPTALAILFFLIALRRDRSRQWLAAGFMAGFAVLVKYPIGLILPSMLLVLFVTRGGWRAAGGSRRVAGPGIAHQLPRIAAYRLGLTDYGLLLAGFLIPLALFVLTMAVRGGLDEFLQIQFGYIPNYNAGFVTDESYLVYTGRRFLTFWQADPKIRWFIAVWLAEVLLSGLFMKWHREQWIVPLWGVAALVYPAVQNQYYYAHMHPLLPPLSIMLAHLVLNLDAFAGRYLPLLRPLVAGAAVLLPFFFLLHPMSPYQEPNVFEEYGNLWSVGTGQEALRTHYTRDDFGIYGWGGFSGQALMEASDYVRQHTAPDDLIFVWSFEPAIYFVSGRDSASRFIYNFPLYGRFAWPEFKADFLREMETTRPALIVVGENEAMPWVSGTEQDSWAAFHDFEAFHDFVNRHYVETARFAQFHIYERQG